MVMELKKPDVKTCKELRAYLESLSTEHDECKIAIIDSHGNLCHIDEVYVESFINGPTYSKDWLIFHVGDPISERELYTETSPGPAPLTLYCALRRSVKTRELYLDYETICPVEKHAEERARVNSKADPIVSITRISVNKAQ